MATTLFDKWRSLEHAVENPALRPLARLTYARLLIYHNVKTNRCDPAVETIADRLGCTGRSVRASLRQLQRLGYILAVRKSRHRTTNQYDLWICSGKNHAPRPEKNDLVTGSEISAKSNKEPKNEKGVHRLRAASLRPKRAVHGGGGCSGAEKKVEEAFLKRFPDIEAGYSVLMDIDGGQYLKIVEAVSMGKMTVFGAVEQLLAIGSQDGIDRDNPFEG